MTHGFVVAQLVLTPEKPEVRQVDESRETGRRQRRDVPEEGEAKEPVEPAQRREASVRERTIEQQMVRLGVRAHQRVFDGTAVPGFEDRELMQQRQRRIGHAASGLETLERAFAGEGGDGAVARVRAQQIHALQLLAEPQVGHASVGDRALPAHLKSPELRQVAQHGQPAVGDLATRVVAEIELLQVAAGERGARGPHR